MARVLITGGTGMIGKRLSQMLAEKGYEVIVLSRQSSVVSRQSLVGSSQSNVSYAQWNIEDGWIDKDAFAKADYIIHLAGAGIADKKWNRKRKQEIVESRTKSSGLIVTALKTIPNKVKAVISASAIGWYGADTDSSLQKGFKETDAAADDFLGNTCKQWEQNIEPVTDLQKRLIILRTGIVLSNDGGAYEEFKKPIRNGIAAILGSGEQVISWIHVEDICRIYIYTLENNQLQGVYNAVAPMPVKNKDFTLQLAKAIRGKYFISVHVPSFILKLMLGEMSIEVLKSTTVSAEKIRQAGFTFLYPSIQAALQLLTNEKN
ncbi:MAG: TIGR01777 family oxidoreductase [Parafilimonas sp.]